MILGYFFGGLAACSILAQLWNHPHLSSDDIMKNVFCIMFGLPGNQFAFTIKQFIQQYPEILDSCHIFLFDDDLHVS